MLRRGPFQVNVLMAGYDEGEGTKLYWMDYLGTLCRVTKGAHGYAAYFINSILDNHYKEGMSLEDGKACMRACVKELGTRFLIKQTNFIWKLVDKNGVKVIEL